MNYWLQCNFHDICSFIRIVRGISDFRVCVWKTSRDKEANQHASGPIHKKTAVNNITQRYKAITQLMC